MTYPYSLDPLQWDIQHSCDLKKDHMFWIAAVGEEKQSLKTTLPFIVTLHWGTAGLPGHKSSKRFRTLHDATLYFTARRRDKTRKGYVYANPAQAPLDLRPILTESAPPKFVETDWDLFS